MRISLLINVRRRLMDATEPGRFLDDLVASTLPNHLFPDLRDGFAFTASEANAGRFVRSVHPLGAWTITRGDHGYRALLSDQNEADEGSGATPAIALLVATMTHGIEGDGWPVVRFAN